MNVNRILIALLLTTAPLALAHTSDYGPISGVPKPYCEDEAGDSYQHEYGAPATGLFLWAPLDGSLGGCAGYDGYDAHAEFLIGGAYLLAGVTTTDCWGAPADHAPFPNVTVDDLVIPSGVPFLVAVDVEPFPCGNFETDLEQACVDACQVTLPPGIDGAYHVYVQGAMGHVST